MHAFDARKPRKTPNALLEFGNNALLTCASADSDSAYCITYSALGFKVTRKEPPCSGDPENRRLVEWYIMGDGGFGIYGGVVGGWMGWAACSAGCGRDCGWGVELRFARRCKE